jgi:transposase-like protein
LRLSQSTVSDLAQSLAAESEALRTRDLRQAPVASLFMDTVDDPLRRWGQKTGVLWVWAIWEDGRKGVLSLSPATSASFESCREG